MKLFSDVPPLHYRVCNYCEAMCGVEISYEPLADSFDKKIKVKPDKNDPFSRGSMCPKAAALGALHFDPEKLRQPVKKVGQQWQKISWQEAYDTIEEKIKSIRQTYGKNSIASYLGNPIVHNLGMMVFVKTLTRAIGSKNVFSATSMDQLPHHFAAHYMFGHEFRIPVPDIDRTDFMIIMGANPLASNGSIMTSAGVTRRLREIEQRGGKFVVIDPRKTETAKIASQHHFIKPGTDVYFLLAFLHITFRSNKVCSRRLKKHLVGFEQLEPLVKSFSADKVSLITGIDKQQIEALVAEFLSHDKAVLYGRMGLSTQPHGGLCHWLINTINIVTGNFDKPGGMMFPTPAIDLARGKQQHVFGRWSSRVRGMKEFAGEFPVSTMADELLTEGEGQVKAFITICGNPVLSSPGGFRLDKGLENIEFMLSIDNYINETTRHADIILPTPSGLEIDHYDLIFNTISVNNNVKFSEALFSVGKNRPYDWQVLKELSRRLSKNGLSLIDKITTPKRLINWGLMLGAYGKLSSPKRWFNGLTLQKVIDSKHGINLGPLQPAVPHRLNTVDKKIHVTPDVFVQRLNEVKLEIDDEKPFAKRGKDQFVLIGRRNVSTNNSWMHQVKKLSRSKQVRCTVMMNPDDADSLQIFHGEKVKVSSRVGEIVLPAEITISMMPGVVSIPHGFGHNKKGTRVSIADTKPGVSVNDITDQMRVDKLTGNAAFSGLTVMLEKISSEIKSRQLSGKPLTIIYASQSGNGEMIAHDLAQTARQYDLLASMKSMDEITLEALAQAQRILLVVSTFGEGDMPDNGEDLWQQISRPDISEQDAANFKKSFYSVLALGDSSYENFCHAGEQWDKRLNELGVTRLNDLIKCDVDYSDSADQWMEEILPLMSEQGDQTIITEQAGDGLAEKSTRYNRKNPMLARLLAKKTLNSKTSSKQTVHYEFLLNEVNGQKDISYQVGDALYLIPKNDIELVDQLLAYFDADGNERVNSKGKSVKYLLLNELEIRTPALDSLKIISHYCRDSRLNSILADATELEQYLWGKDLLDLLQCHPVMKQHFDEIFVSLKPISARAYSISSSIKKYPSQVHLTVATVRYQNEKRQHQGVCSTYLADSLQVGDNIACYFAPNKYFSVPENGDAAMIMVGPGTGVAPFRGFLQERECRGDKGGNWLFFGDRNLANDFLYQEEFEAMKKSGLLSKLDLAFSRDQEEKIYVQQRMLENAEQLYDWLDAGAYFYVCGDAERMAKDVDKALHDIVQQQGEMSKPQAAQYIEQLKQEKRYVRDVY